MLHAEFLAFPSLEGYFFFLTKSDLRYGIMHVKDVLNTGNAALSCGASNSARPKAQT